MRLTFLGTSDVRQVPVFGCECAACQRAQRSPEYRRGAASARLEAEGFSLLLDAGRHDLVDIYTPHDIQAICLTHYHMDHVYGLFRLRWGTGTTIPVYGPPDEKGCDDLFKHPGILQFQRPNKAGESFTVGPFRLWSLALNHSRICHGYGIEWRGNRIAYLTDTLDLPEDTENFLKNWGAFTLIIDCTWPPQESVPRNHNDIRVVQHIIERLKPEACWLTHLDHEMDCWLMNGGDAELATTTSVAYDNQTLAWSRS